MIPLYPNQPYTTIPPDEQGIVTIPCSLPTYGELASGEPIAASAPFLKDGYVRQVFWDRVSLNQELWWSSQAFPSQPPSTPIICPGVYVRGFNGENGIRGVTPPADEDWIIIPGIDPSQPFYKYRFAVGPKAPLVRDLLLDGYGAVDWEWTSVENPYNADTFELALFPNFRSLYYIEQPRVGPYELIFATYRHFRRKPGSIIPLVTGFMFPLLFLMLSGVATASASGSITQQNPVGRKRRKKP
jgi:hypothetical protein